MNQNLAPKMPRMPGRPPAKGPKGRAPLPPQRPFWANMLYALLVFLALSSLYGLVAERKVASEEIPISQVAAEIESGNVKSIVVRGDELSVELSDGMEKLSKKEVDAALTETLAAYGIEPAQLADIGIDIRREAGFRFWAGAVLPIVAPIFLVLLFVWLLTRQVRGAGMQAFSFGQSRARFFDPKDKQKVTFADVAGVKEAKEELMEIVDFLKNPKKFEHIGAQIPKGVLLMGPPGSGKTLLARAVAGQADVPFFSVSGSEFVEMFVGVGASRVRDLFQTVKRAAPAILFIDEIDAVGRVRGGGLGGGNDEREQTLNQILVEMDGFEPNEEVIVLASTNRPDVLDPALLRPGRFDRRVKLDLPDRKDREEILKIHARKKPLAEDVALKTIAERTPGFSGADLYSLMNEAAILAARENRTKVSQYDLIRSIEKVMLGPERKSHILSEHEKKITAYHEAGHALVASVLPHADPVHKVSIISRGYAAGYTLALPMEERRLHSRKDFIDRLAVTLGGYVTELMIFGDVTTGPSSDLQIATALARDMVTRYGMSDKVGPVALETDTGRVLVGAGGFTDREYSEKAAALIDAEVTLLIDNARKTAETVIRKHRKLLDAIVVRLLEAETIEQGDFESILIAHGIKIKRALGTEGIDITQ